MSLETEAVLDRRRLKRATALWRVSALAAGAIAIGVLALSGSGGMHLRDEQQIARVTVDGLITEDREQLRMLGEIADAKHVEGLIVQVNSPGGTTTGGEALFEAIRKVAEKKPVVAQFGTVAASAGYITGLATDYIVARGNSITGSVGVIMQWPEVSELLAKLGVKMNEVRSGSLKAIPSMFQPLDDPGRLVTEQMIQEGKQWFLGLVASRRGVKTAEIPGLELGRIFSGREALQYKLVDEIGGDAEVLHWLEDKRKLKHGLKVVDWKPKRETKWGVSSLLGQAIATGITQAVHDTIGTALQEAGFAGVRLDGFVSVWHPANN